MSDYTDETFSHADRRIKFAFTQGDCWMLAMHMSEVTGMEPVVIGEDDGFGDDIYEGFDWHHAFVWNPETQLCYDVDGVHTLDEMFERYADNCPEYPSEIRTAHANHFKDNFSMFNIPVEEGERVLRQTAARTGNTVPNLRERELAQAA